MRQLLLIVWFVMLAPALVAARATPEAPPLPRDDRETWRVGILRFEAVDLESQDSWLARSVPLMFLESFSVLTEHRLSDAERSATQYRILERARASAGRELDQQRLSRDRLLFAEITADMREDRRESTLQLIQTAERDLEWLLALDASDVVVPTHKPIEFYEQGRELLPAGLARGRAAAVHNLDLVIYGSVGRLDADYLIIETFAFSAAQERVVFHDTEVLTPDEVAGLLGAIVDRMADTMLGRSWASLTVITPQPDAAIIVDGTLYGFGTVTVGYLEPGPRRVVVVHEEIERLETAVLLPSERARLEIELPSPEADSVFISSDPSGADVYVDSVWFGRTPVSVPRPTGTATVLLQREHHLDSRFLIGPDTPDSMSRILAGDILGWSEQTLSSRDRFYRSLGFFVLSLPMPIILSGVYDNLFTLFAGGAPADLNSSDADRLTAAGDTVYWSYWASVGISTGLFANMVVRLVRYIRTAESYHFH